MIEIWLAFLAGLAGSTHCIGMCGGIVTAIAMMNQGMAPGSRQLFQLFYNLGRVTTYTLLGVTVGFIGSSLDLLAVRSAAMWIFAGANLFVMVIGIASFLSLPALNLFALDGGGGRYFSRPLHWALAGTSPLRAFPLGLILGFLPCGMVYTPLIAAAASGQALKGGAIMAALGLGTLPLLFFFGASTTVLTGRMRGLLLRLAGLIVALMGGAGLWRVLGKMTGCVGSCCGS